MAFETYKAKFKFHDDKTAQVRDQIKEFDMAIVIVFKRIIIIR